MYKSSREDNFLNDIKTIFEMKFQRNMNTSNSPTVQIVDLSTKFENLKARIEKQI